MGMKKASYMEGFELSGRSILRRRPRPERDPEGIGVLTQPSCELANLQNTALVLSSPGQAVEWRRLLHDFDGGLVGRIRKEKGRWSLIGLAVIASLAFGAAGFALRPVPPTEVSDQVKDYPLTGPAQPFQFTAIGDSYTGGSPMGGSRGTPTNWVLHTAAAIRAKGTQINENESGIGGSGYVNRGPEGDTFGERAAKVINSNTDVIVFFGSINDQRQPLDEITAAAEKAWTGAKAKSPNAQFIIVGPAWMRRDVPPAIDAITQSLKALATKHGFDFVDPDAERWFLDSPELIGSDGTHPIDAGHVLISDKLTPRIEAAIARKGKPNREF